MKRDKELSAILDELQEHLCDVHGNWADSDEPLLIALWIVHTHFIRSYEFRYDYTVYLHAVSHEPDSGKSELARAIARICPGDGSLRFPTLAQIKRFLAKPINRVLIIDQFHNLGRARSIDHEYMTQMMCNGYAPGVKIEETLPNGDTVTYDPYFPKAFFGLSSYTPDSELQSRCIKIVLRPCTETQGRILEERQNANPPVACGNQLRTRIEQYANQENANELNRTMIGLGKNVALNPGYGSLLRREADNWRMLIALADMAGDVYGKRIRNLAERKTISHSTEITEENYSEAERFDRAILTLARTGRLPVDNWKFPNRSPITDHPNVQIRATEFGWPRDGRYGKKDRLPTVSLLCNDEKRTAELRIPVIELDKILSALNVSRTEFVNAYRSVNRLHSQKGRDTISLAMFSGQKETKVVAINFSPMVYERTASILDIATRILEAKNEEAILAAVEGN